MHKLQGVGGRLALHSSLFDRVAANKKECEEHIGDFDFYNPDCELFIPYIQDKFFYFYCEVDGVLHRGIFKNDGQVLAYSNFDDAIILSDDFILVKKDNYVGFINASNLFSSPIEYASLDLEPSKSLNLQNSSKRLAAIGKKLIGDSYFFGALDEFGNILIPFEYTHIEYKINHVLVYQIGKQAKVPIAELNPKKEIILTPTNQELDYDNYDSDVWGMDSEMDYIRNNGGDWIDD